MALLISGETDTGKVRKSNQDAIASRLSGDGRQALLVVADGMGGYQGGEIASQITVEAILDIVEPYLESGDSLALGRNQLENAIQNAIDQASERIRVRQAEDASLAKMGTTVVLAWVVDDQAHIAHLGDSRCYLISDGKLQCLTRDDTVVQNMLEDGSITAADVPNVPFRNVLTRALGASDSPLASFYRIGLAAGDQLLLCSDGLNDALPEEDWLPLMERAGSPDDQVRALIDSSLENQAPDNVSVVLLTID